MEVSTAFHEMAEQFYQDILEDCLNENELINFVLSPFRDQSKRERLRAYLDYALSTEISDDELLQIWLSTPTNIVYDKKHLRALLAKIRGRL
ncbi:hypothetical protein ACFQE0_01755 [Methylobacterium komagatae]|uniref:CdiI immunity protein domain-containing protein n=1 Tax=Methylobacterium komagatae TaxID=374425 RepID=A0ABW2BER2_9HYPH